MVQRTLYQMQRPCGVGEDVAPCDVRWTEGMARPARL